MDNAVYGIWSLGLSVLFATAGLGLSFFSQSFPLLHFEFFGGGAWEKQARLFFLPEK